VSNLGYKREEGSFRGERGWEEGFNRRGDTKERIA